MSATIHQLHPDPSPHMRRAALDRLALHPVFTPSDFHRMSASELSFFTDAPVAHVVAQQDFLRAARIAERNREVLAHITALQRVS